MVTVGLVTDCSEPAATKNAVGHGVSSLRAEDSAVLGSSTPGVTSRKVLDIPGPHEVRTGDTAHRYVVDALALQVGFRPASPTQGESTALCDLLPHGRCTTPPVRTLANDAFPDRTSRRPSAVGCPLRGSHGESEVVTAARNR